MRFQGLNLGRLHTGQVPYPSPRMDMDNFIDILAKCFDLYLYIKGSRYMGADLTLETQNVA